MKKKQLLNVLNILYLKKVLNLNSIILFKNSLQENLNHLNINCNVLNILPFFKTKSCISIYTQIQILNIDSFTFYSRIVLKNLIILKYYNLFIFSKYLACFLDLSILYLLLQYLYTKLFFLIYKPFLKIFLKH